MLILLPPARPEAHPGKCVGRGSSRHCGLRIYLYDKDTIPEESQHWLSWYYGPWGLT